MSELGDKIRALQLGLPIGGTAHTALDQAASLADEHAAALAEARREGMREAYDLCKGVRRGAETDDYGIGALDCAIAILAAAEKEAGNG